MNIWTIHEITAACGLTPGELSQWIARDLFKPSAQVRSGQRREFDWRDLACLAAMSELRKHSFSIGGIELIISELRENLDRIEDIPTGSVLRFVCADRSDLWRSPTIGFMDDQKLFELLKHRPTTIIIVDVAAVYQKALASIAGVSEKNAGGQPEGVPRHVPHGSGRQCRRRLRHCGHHTDPDLADF